MEARLTEGFLPDMPRGLFRLSTLSWATALSGSCAHTYSARKVYPHTVNLCFWKHKGHLLSVFAMPVVTTLPLGGRLGG